MNEPPNSRYFALCGAATPSCGRSVQPARDAPDLLDAELPGLRRLAAQLEAVERRLGEVALHALGEHRHAGEQVGAGLEVAELLAVAPAPLVARPDSGDAAVVDEQARRRGLRQDHRPGLLGLPASQRPNRDRETIEFPWLRIVGGGGIGTALPFVSR